jgi:hypothetical protein
MVSLRTVRAAHALAGGRALPDLTAGRLTVSAASELMGLERRQVLRLSKAYQADGATALISKKRGRASNRRTPAETQARTLD